MAEEKIMADGMFYKDKHPNAPEFVLGGLSIKIDQFAQFVKTHKDGEYLNFQILKSKAGKPYIVLDTWNPKKKQEPKLTTNYKENTQIEEDVLPF